ncbi:MAG TPA: ABC transporter ATP-binding protein [Bacteroidales bacterium]|nr:ABC transporter ATP-binding protein [Bacteroidales bacterium]
MMKQKIQLFRESLKLVWQSAPGWATANAILSVVRSIMPLLLLWLLRNVIDGITGSASSAVTADNTILPIIALVFVWFLDETLSDAGIYIRKKQSVRFEAYMYDLLHSKASRLDLINFEHPEYFDCLSRATREATWRPNNILNNLISISGSLLSLLLISGLIITLNWIPAVLLIAANVPGIWMRLHYAEVLYNVHREQTPEARKSAYFNWLLTGDRPAREIRLFGLGDHFRRLFRESFMKQKQEELQIIRKRTLIGFISDLVKASAFLFTLLLIAKLTAEHKITLGEMAMFLVAFRQGMVYIKEFFSSLSDLYEDGLFLGDIFEFLNLKEYVIAHEPVIMPAPLLRDLVAENLSFSYPGNSRKAVDNISFGLRRGEILAIVGPNGSGKSTLAKLICRLYDPECGSIRYDDIDIRNFDPALYRRNVSVIFQDFMLYNMTAGDNIRMGDISNAADQARIKQAADVTGIGKLIEQLPDRYETQIGNLFDDSRELSWGEWQKMALARALYRNAPVLILDEPSSSLDAETEYEIFRRFREIVKGRTAVLISHRFMNVSLADRIIVMDRGKIAETGSHEELMSLRGLYHSMFMKQTSRFER